MEFICETCDFKTNVKTNYARHLLTKKHLKLCEPCEEIPKESSPLESIQLKHEMEMQKMKYEYELKIKDIMLQCEKEKNELLMMWMAKVPQEVPSKVALPVVEMIPDPVVETIMPIIVEPVVETIPEVKKKSKFELLTPVASEPTPEPIMEVKNEKPKSDCKVRTIKEFVEKKCKVNNNHFSSFVEKINEKITTMDINKLASKRINKTEYAFGLIKEVYDSYDKYNKPYYNDDKYHKKCYCVNKTNEWVKEEISDNVFAILAKINGHIMEKAEDMGKVYRITDEMVDAWYETNGYDQACPFRVGNLSESKEFNNLNILDYDDYDVFIDSIVEKFNDIIYITKEDMA